MPLVYYSAITLLHSFEITDLSSSAPAIFDYRSEISMHRKKVYSAQSASVTSIRSPVMRGRALRVGADTNGALGSSLPVTNGVV